MRCVFSLPRAFGGLQSFAFAGPMCRSLHDAGQFVALFFSRFGCGECKRLFFQTGSLQELFAGFGLWQPGFGKLRFAPFCQLMRRNKLSMVIHAALCFRRFYYFCVPLLQAALFFNKNGPVAERLGSALQKLLLRFESGRDLDKNRKPGQSSGFSVYRRERKACFADHFCKQKRGATATIAAL